ncbi:MAG: hypothetical protein LBF38_05425 [Deltaproteobacteria bacterium]|jgi:hypothetical protein|nr:hypothetical protein [Deltaproteobacteria bacterium]
MKIRQDFVTNSSSTSFIISIKGDFTLENFLKGLRMNKDCALMEMVENLYKVIYRAKKELSFYKDNDNEDIEETIRGLWVPPPDGLVEEVKKLLADNREVYAGNFHTEASCAEELFLCYARYVISTEDLYFNCEDLG